jgi:AcrR family transcriptional regulator
MDERSGTGLPASIEAAWGLRGRPGKGPRPGLSLERIVDAAVRVAAAEGLGAVSMSRVAGDLGVSTMALYRYVAAKDELLVLMVDAAGGAPPPPPAGESWRAGLERWARGYLEVLRRHPWILRVPINSPPVTPNQILWLEDGLRSMRDTGLREDEKASVILLLSGYVRNYATLAADIQAAAAAPGSTTRELSISYGRILARVADPERFPAVHAVISAGAFDDADEDAPGMEDEFAFGLERVLDGIEALVRTRRRPARRRTASR